MSNCWLRNSRAEKREAETQRLHRALAPFSVVHCPFAGCHLLPRRAYPTHAMRFMFYVLCSMFVLAFCQSDLQQWAAGGPACAPAITLRTAALHARHLPCVPHMLLFTYRTDFQLTIARDPRRSFRSGGGGRPGLGAGGPRRPRAGEDLPDNCKLYVANLSPAFTEGVLRSLFEPFGQVLYAALATDPATQQPRGFGFVHYPNPETAQAAVAAMNGRPVDGKNLVVRLRSDAPVRGAPREPRVRACAALVMSACLGARLLLVLGPCRSGAGCLCAVGRHAVATHAACSLVLAGSLPCSAV